MRRIMDMLAVLKLEINNKIQIFIQVCAPILLVIKEKKKENSITT